MRIEIQAAIQYYGSCWQLIRGKI